MQSFKDAYTMLNDEQRAAVDYIDGPLLVLAGPGTGKTQLLSARVAQILRETDSKPQNILALTFTDKAAQNMKQRLLTIVGPAGRKVVVKTFHGLGLELINMYPEHFWSGANLQPAPEAVELEIIEDVLKRRPLDDHYALKFMGKFTMADRARKHISQAKKAGLTPNKLRAISRLNIAQLSALQDDWAELLDTRMSKKLFDQYQQLFDNIEFDNDIDIAPTLSITKVLHQSLERAIAEARELDSTKPLTEWKNDWTEKVNGVRQWTDIRRSERMLALADVYEEFQNTMLAGGYYDFDDMILEVITQLEADDDFRADVQERFTHIMIDEFQDTNDAQFRLAYLVASHPAQEQRPNIMAVGDDDQAIYRFQGAELSNIDNFSNSFRNTTEIMLTKNYRSHQSVIDASLKTAELIEHRLVDLRPKLTKNITQAADVSKDEIVHKMYSSEAEQLTEVAALAKEAFDAEKRVAVLSRSHAPLEQLAGIFHQQGAPVRYSQRNDVLRMPAIEITSTIARCVVAIGDFMPQHVNESVADILGHPMFSVNSKQLWQFGVDCRKQRISDWLAAAELSDTEDISRVATWLRDLATEATHQPAAVMIEYILGLRELNGFTSPLKTYYLDEGSNAYLETLSAVQKLRSLVAEFRADMRPQLNDFVRFIDMNREHQVQITDESAFVSSDRAIELLSVHSAKGLEFDDVFVIDATDNTWSPGGARFRPPANMEAMRPHGDDDDDYARLMFVAMTRARSRLTITSYQLDEHGKEVLPTPLISHLPVEQISDSSKDLITAAENILRWPSSPVRDQGQLLAPILESYSLPVTHLLNFIDITSGGPLEFVERNLLRLPTVKTAHMAYGTAIHAALEQAQRDVNANKLDVDKAIKTFSESLRGEQLPVHDEKRYLDKGQKLLSELLISGRLQLTVGTQPERTVRDITLENGAVLQGKLDAVNSSDDRLQITDYKTGRGLRTLDTYSQRDGLKALKHQLQLTFYVLLAGQSNMASAQQEAVGEMVYVESEDDKQFRVEHSPDKEELERLQRLIGAVWSRIHSQDWPDISSYEESRAGVEKFIDDLINENL